MDKLPQTPDTYDKMFADGGFGGAFKLPYRSSWYYPMYKSVVRATLSHSARCVLEVGCGSGGLAHLLFDRSDIAYQGFDFSNEAVEQARDRTGRHDAFYVADATEPKTYTCEYDTIICTEVLEHIEPDRDVIMLWKSQTYCICTVPNFDAATHVRFFCSEDEVRHRYGDLIAIEHIERVRKPLLPDISWRNRIRHFIWNRYRPRRLLAIMGIAPFDDGGWFVFTGRRI